MKKALAPVERRLRMQRGLNGLCWGLLAALAAAAGILLLSFLLPLRSRNALLLPLPACPLLGLLAGLLWPLPIIRTARAADACGLQERAQTALALLDRRDEMALLQRQDTLQALKNLDVRRALPLKAAKDLLIAAAACLIFCAGMAFVPNPQDAVLRRQEQFLQRMEKPAEAVKQAAEELEEAQLSEKTARELRRLMGDLNRELGRSRDSREAMTALSRAQQKLDQLLNESKNAAMEALGQAGLDSLARAMAEGSAAELEQALQDALADADAGELAEQMNEAAENAENAEAAAALSAAAQALSQGSAAQAAQALSQLSAAGLSAGQLSAALQAAKAAAGGMGQGQSQSQGSGSGGNSAGSGQGQGSGGGAWGKIDDALLNSVQ